MPLSLSFNFLLTLLNEINIFESNWICCSPDLLARNMIDEVSNKVEQNLEDLKKAETLFV